MGTTSHSDLWRPCVCTGNTQNVLDRVWEHMSTQHTDDDTLFLSGTQVQVLENTMLPIEQCACLCVWSY